MALGRSAFTQHKYNPADLSSSAVTDLVLKNVNFYSICQYTCCQLWNVNQSLSIFSVHFVPKPKSPLKVEYSLLESHLISFEELDGIVFERWRFCECLFFFLLNCS